jgi:hypothetical protein
MRTQQSSKRNMGYARPAAPGLNLTAADTVIHYDL